MNAAGPSGFGHGPSHHWGPMHNLTYLQYQQQLGAQVARQRLRQAARQGGGGTADSITKNIVAMLVFLAAAAVIIVLWTNGSLVLHRSNGSAPDQPPGARGAGGAAVAQKRPLNPRIQISPSSGPPGSRVTVKGTGFPASAEVTIMFHLTEIGQTRSDRTGAFKITVRVPQNKTSKTFPWTITARSRSYAAAQPFQIT